MNVWVLIYRAGWIVLTVLFVVGAISIFAPQFRQYRELQRKDALRQQEVQLEDEMLKHLKEQQERLKTDPRFVERIAREEIGLAKPGETVVKFSDDETRTNRNPPR